jgi:hypothetical protein
VRSRTPQRHHLLVFALLVQGVDARTVMDMMGWSQLSMTSATNTSRPGLKREAAERMNDLLCGDTAAR